MKYLLIFLGLCAGLSSMMFTLLCSIKSCYLLALCGVFGATGGMFLAIGLLFNLLRINE